MAEVVFSKSLSEDIINHYKNYEFYLKKIFQSDYFC